MPVITEAAWMLRYNLRIVEDLFGLIIDGELQLADVDRTAMTWIARFINRYKDLPAQFADAALMYLAEARDIQTILTLDRRDFTVYRTTSGASLRLIPDHSG